MSANPQLSEDEAGGMQRVQLQLQKNKQLSESKLALVQAQKRIGELEVGTIRIDPRIPTCQSQLTATARCTCHTG